jgi:hypothetical protein
VKRILVILPFLLAACGEGATAPVAPATTASAAHFDLTQPGSCTIYGQTYQRGFDANGYNQCADNFNGTGASWCIAGNEGSQVNTEACINGLGVYAPDKLVMKWNDAWDACNNYWKTHVGTEEAACAGAWEDNEWNGRFPGGSGEAWHYKIVWIGSCVDGTTLPDGGYCIWGAYETVMDQGIDPNVGPGHIWNALAKPNGYGG